MQWFTIRVVAPPKELSIEQQRRLVLLQVGFAIETGDVSRARLLSDQAAARFPDDSIVVGYAAVATLEAGDPDAALVLVQRAISIVAAKYPDAQEPPRHLSSVERRIRAAIAAKKTPHKKL